MKILILDDHALFRVGLRMLLSVTDPSATILEAANTPDALGLVWSNPDIQICLLDLALKNDSGMRALRQIREAAPGIAIVVVSATQEIEIVRACIDAGAMSYIPKSAEPEVLAEALRRVIAGETYLPAEVLESGTSDAKPRTTLTHRQREVLRELSRGLPTKSISFHLSLSENTVKEHITAIFRALDVRNRTEAVIMATRYGLLLED